MANMDLVKAWFDGEAECPRETHPEVAGPNMDIGQCQYCGMPMGVMRPTGESFGWHIEDCSLPFGHTGHCVPGGEGHEIPRGWTIRG